MIKEARGPYAEQENFERAQNYLVDIPCKILIIEDDNALRFAMKHALELDGHDILEAASAVSAQKILREETPDLILLDLGLPDGNGLKLMPEIKACTDAPVIITSGKNKAADKVEGLEKGADDYLCKPFTMEELRAHAKAKIRRYKTPGRERAAGEPQKITFGKWTMDRSRYQIFDENGRSGDLTVKEFLLLETLIKASGRVLTREQLFAIVRDEDSDATERAVDVQITRIRQKISEDARNPLMIKTIRGIGYMFEDESQLCS